MRLAPLSPLLLIAIASIAAAKPVAVSAPPALSYTAEQAEEGAKLYAQRCAMCHGRALEGTYETPGLTGKFVANWGRRPLSDLYDYMGRAMPQFAPGSLTHEDNARLIAFLLKANGAPAGTAPLPVDGAALRKLRLEPPKRP